MAWQDGVAIITGATSGIGAGVARELGGAGMRLVVTGRRRDRLDALAAELPAGRVAVVAGDIRDAALPDQLVKTALDRFGRLDLVFNNAGLMRVGTIDEMDLAGASLMIQTNVEATMRVSYTVLRQFKRQGSGLLINLSSILGTKVRPTAGVYAATKHAIEALSQALRMEVAGTGVKVSVLEPGFVETELQAHFPVSPRKLFNITAPLQPADIARCVRFLLEQPPHVCIPVMMILPAQQAM